MRAARSTDGANGSSAGAEVSVRDVTETLSLEEFLALVGERVRRRRTLVHLSRRRLAERSGVSERYLAQLERGQGNMSIALLRRVAAALALPLSELVAESDAESEVAQLAARDRLAQ